MLKNDNSLKNRELAVRGSEQLLTLVAQVPLIEVEHVDWERTTPDWQSNFLVHVKVAGHRRTFVCEVNSNGQPRFVRSALLELRHYVAEAKGNVSPILIAPAPKFRRAQSSLLSDFACSEAVRSVEMTQIPSSTPYR